LYLGVVIDLFGNLVKAAVSLGCQFDLDEGGYVFLIGLIPVDNSLIAENDTVFFICLDRLFDIALLLVKHNSKLLGGEGCVFF
jgi:hypothetical protein